MTLIDRLIYALMAAFFGALLGGVGWWLYGMANSLTYSGHPLDPVFRHWVIGGAAGFGVLGFVMGARVADVAGDAFNAMLHFEFSEVPYRTASVLALLLFCALLLAAIWFTTPGR